MGRNHQAGPSLFLAEHDTAHREHIHQHHILHNKRQAATAIANSVVTEVVATVSVVQQINVDSNGVTIAVQTVLDTPSANSTIGAAATTAISIEAVAAVATPDGSAPSTTPETSPGTTDSSAVGSSTLCSSSSATTSQSFTSSSSTSTALTSSPLSSTTFASLVPNTNSTTIIATPTSSLSGFSNSSITSTILSSSTLSLTPLLSAASSSAWDFADDSAESSTSSFYSPTTSSSPAVASTGTGFLGGGSGTSPGSSSSSHTAGSGSGSGSGSNSADGGSNSSAPSTPVVVGGVVGGVAGAAILIFLLMILVRWKKRHSSMFSLGSGEPPASSETTRGLPPPPPVPTGMIERASRVFAVPAIFPSFSAHNRNSAKTDRTVSSTAGSERGFYRVSGRKLPSVFQHGGDGYGGGLDDSNTLSGSSFYRDSQGFYGGPGTPTTSGPMSMSTQRDSGIPVMRPSPARTPVTEHAFFSMIPAPLNITRRPDVLGRSHPSQDGSHTSRFTEEV